VARLWVPVRRLSAVAAVGVGGAWVALLLVGPLEYPVGPFDVDYLLRPGPGRTDLRLPPFGELYVDTHTGPLYLTATVARADPDRVTQAVGSDIPGLADRIEMEGLAALRTHAFRALLITLAGAGIGGLLIFRTRWPRVVAAAAAGTVLIGATGGLAAMTFRPESFRDPTYSGSLRTAVQLLGPIQEVRSQLARFRTEVARLAEQALAAYEGLALDQSPTERSTAVLHISDLHASPLGMDFAQEVARSFEVDAVVDTGDITSFGTLFETALIDRISSFGVPYVFVQGNHDSSAVVEVVAAEPNALVLDQEAVTVAGLTIYGAPHPLYTPDPDFDLSDDQIREAVIGAGTALADGVSGLPEPPDVVAVHDDRLALASTGLVPLVISGHFHATGHRVIEDTLFLRVGTTGGGGLDTFASEEAIPLAAQILYFDQTSGALVAVDLVELDPVTRNLTIDRQLAADLAGEAPVPGPSPAR
jgi:Calcineurin-like phosphoesterase superfamily domain